VYLIGLIVAKIIMDRLYIMQQASNFLSDKLETGLKNFALYNQYIISSKSVL
jgi:hypothetical protein